MVYKSVIYITTFFLFSNCSNLKKEIFHKEKEIISVFKELNIKKTNKFIFYVVRTSRCNLCNEVARDLFNNENKETILLMDMLDTSFKQLNVSSNKEVFVKNNIFFESRGIDFGENYIFFIENNKIINYIIISKETKMNIINEIQDFF